MENYEKEFIISNSITNVGNDFSSERRKYYEEVWKSTATGRERKCTCSLPRKGYWSDDLRIYGRAGDTGYDTCHCSGSLHSACCRLWSDRFWKRKSGCGKNSLAGRTNFTGLRCCSGDATIWKREIETERSYRKVS